MCPKFGKVVMSWIESVADDEEKNSDRKNKQTLDLSKQDFSTIF